MNLSVQAAYHMLERFQVVDVREPEEWADGLLPGALRLPLSRLQALAPLYLERERPVLLYCRSGNRSQEALQTLKNLGHLEGGLKGRPPLHKPCITGGTHAHRSIQRHQPARSP